METINSLLQDPHIVLQIANMPQYKIKQSQINRMRRAYRGGVIEEIEKYRVKPNAEFTKLPYSDESTARKFDLPSFLTRIPLYKGIQQFYMESADETAISDAPGKGLASRDR